ncbi:formamidopyrimidine-DNA glycosylase [Cryobacterium psychrotolerans]|uniref:Formamidopyrimidine-DNA glycosylase n=1 Tax=Cryobacterium psychrotolerans TaxID=386301 RepID=A0A1G9DU92_9MICO|nr:MULTISPECIES: bifunctional DNA-formamidopyrimidine glycosylase/DNA-(apurinic or apyrimidinic site) lyase [Cryobacterium]TFD40950.1 bifunctional DNA-formamidopyrimidine glycosylase/DNA-(apurinic or apyrimidinic site) lyase [Cryobacterium sp. TMT1-2-1]TFD83412.1 bifunctional DNA-formamidopyrimidine glycosylase/DNA-(apurinic or apyrimidinic site) lyase [Cryobacterium psychrotolerans]SDK67426.1 formamidopyrimidine-DNA glycosylase [Cryobacterium psychrotolerans]
MPELPEVEVVRAGIEPAVTGAVISAVEVFEQRSLRRHDLSAGPFTDLLEGRRVLAAVRRGKFLWLPLDSGRALVIHLGMSGQVLLRAPGSAARISTGSIATGSITTGSITGGRPAEDRLLRIRLHLEHPVHGELWLNFVDQRIFGSMAVDRMQPTSDGLPAGFPGAAAAGEWETLIPSQVAHIARDPIDPAFPADAFFRALARKKTGIKRALLDQTLISGIGNIYADEALFDARIHFDQPAASLTAAKARTLLASVRGILHRALAEGGTSFDAQYVNVNGESGYFSHSLTAYGQHGKPCLRCGTTMVRAQFMNRSSHFCPRCQRLR